MIDDPVAARDDSAPGAAGNAPGIEAAPPAARPRPPVPPVQPASSDSGAASPASDPPRTEAATEPDEAPVVVTADLPVDVVCPQCGTAARVDGVRRAAEDFCRTCDYPLFWAVERHPAAVGDGSDTGLRRLPGTAGRASLAALRCPSCTEPNPPSAVTCARCGVELRPAPVVFAPPPPPEPEPEVAVVEPAPLPWWRSWWALLGAVALVVLVDVVVLLLVFW